jgi:spore germination protein GerM
MLVSQEMTEGYLKKLLYLANESLLKEIFGINVKHEIAPLQPSCFPTNKPESESGTLNTLANDSLAILDRAQKATLF